MFKIINETLICSPSSNGRLLTGDSHIQSTARLNSFVMLTLNFLLLAGDTLLEYTSISNGIGKKYTDNVTSNRQLYLTKLSNRHNFLTYIKALIQRQKYVFSTKPLYRLVTAK